MAWSSSSDIVCVVVSILIVLPQSLSVASFLIIVSLYAISQFLDAEAPHDSIQHAQGKHDPRRLFQYSNNRIRRNFTLVRQLECGGLYRRSTQEKKLRDLMIR